MADGNEALRSDGLTLEQIAAKLKVSKERIRQIEHRALMKCRRWAEKHGYKFEDLTSVWGRLDWE